MIEKISLGPNIRRKIDMMAPKVRDALLAEESRMSAEFCAAYMDQGVIVESFYDRTGMPALEYFPIDARCKIVDEQQTEMKEEDYWITRYENPINSDDFPLSVVLDVEREENNVRYYTIAFYTKNLEEMVKVKSRLDPLHKSENTKDHYDYYDKVFYHYWFITELQANMNKFSAALRQKFDEARSESHAIGSGIIRSACARIDVWMSWRIEKDFFTFVAHLLPDRKNPFVKILSNRHQSNMSARQSRLQ